METEDRAGSSKKFSRSYTITSDVLRSGGLWKESEGKHKKKGKKYNIKVFNRNKLTDEDINAIFYSVDILKAFDHPNIIRFVDFFEEPNKYYLVTERMSGGELFDRVQSKVCYSEKQACKLFVNILDAVNYCHSNDIAHRDLKPENILLSSEDSDTDIKLTNFDFATHVESPNSLTTTCGTPGYVAPEILEGFPYDTKADMWSVGVIFFIVLGGYQPFIEEKQSTLFKRIKKGDYKFDEEWWSDISDDAKDLISSLLNIDPHSRLSAKKTLRNKWLSAGKKSDTKDKKKSKKK